MTPPWLTFRFRMRACGFALLEILVAIAILSVLATGSLWMITRLNATLSARSESDMQKSIAEAVIRYYNDTGSFPNTLGNLLDQSGVVGLQGPYIAETAANLVRDSWWNDSLGNTREWVCDNAANQCAIVALGPNHVLESNTASFPVVAVGDDIVRNIHKNAALQVGDRGIARAKKDIAELNEAALNFKNHLENCLDIKGTGESDDDQDTAGNEGGNCLAIPSSNDPFGSAATGPVALAGHRYLGNQSHGGQAPNLPAAWTSAVLILRNNGFVGENLTNDPWGNPYRWDRSGAQFFSRGPADAGLASNAGCNDGNDISATAVGQSLGGANCTNAF